MNWLLWKQGSHFYFMRTLTQIVCVSPRGIIGLNGNLPWKLPEDLAWFREFTMGKVCIFGSRALREIRVTRGLSGRKDLLLPGRDVLEFTHDLHLWEKAPSDSIICGGAQTYAHFMPRTREVYMSVITKGLDDSEWGMRGEEVTFYPAWGKHSRLACSEIYRDRVKSKTGMEFSIMKHTLVDLKQFQNPPAKPIDCKNNSTMETRSLS